MPFTYMTPSRLCALACPASAALAYHFAASAKSCLTSLPLTYISPRLYSAVTLPCSAIAFVCSKSVAGAGAVAGAAEAVVAGAGIVAAGAGLAATGAAEPVAGVGALVASAGLESVARNRARINRRIGRALPMKKHSVAKVTQFPARRNARRLVFIGGLLRPAGAYLLTRCAP